MSRKTLILFCSLVLIATFSAELSFSLSHSDAVVAFDSDVDTEKEEKKAASVIENKYPLFYNDRLDNLPIPLGIANQRWANPILDIKSPPPRFS